MTLPEFGEDPNGYPESSQATTALVLGILGLLISGLVAPFAWYIGQREIEAMDAGRRPPENRQIANIGRILGIIGTVLLALALILLTLLFAVVFDILDLP